MLRSLVATTLLAASTALFAQTAPAPADKPAGKAPHARHDCSKAKDPKACEERKEKFREARKKAKSACDGKDGAEKRECLRKEMCAQAKEPAQCEARAKERAEKHKARMEERKKKRMEQDQKK
jgi:Spy/CpxP family protein refolding chaperone